jgi:hypothetical protein
MITASKDIQNVFTVQCWKILKEPYEKRGICERKTEVCIDEFIGHLLAHNVLNESSAAQNALMSKR